MKRILTLIVFLTGPVFTFASEADLPIPDLKQSYFPALGTHGWNLLMWGFIVIVLGMLFGLWQYRTIKRLPAHKSMLNVAHIIYETCKTYLIQQGRFLVILFLIVAVCAFRQVIS